MNQGFLFDSRWKKNTCFRLSDRYSTVAGWSIGTLDRFLSSASFPLSVLPLKISLRPINCVEQWQTSDTACSGKLLPTHPPTLSVVSLLYVQGDTEGRPNGIWEYRLMSRGVSKEGKRRSRGQACNDGP